MKLALLMNKILLLGGPSGCGKTFFASEHLAQRGWVHLEVDQFGKDGITELGLRNEWDAFWLRFDPISLRDKLFSRGGGAEGIVLSFPSTLVFSPKHLRAAQGSFQIAYLFGNEGHCLNSFLKRERQLNRGLGVAHWGANNSNVFSELNRPENLPLLVSVFHEDGTRRDPKDVYGELFRA